MMRVERERREVEPEASRLLRTSVVIPAFNEAETLAGVLTGLLNLPGVQVDEILVVDDGSTDDTSQVAGAFDGVTVLRSPYNKGNGASVKTGIRHATGEIIVVLDADGQHPSDQIPELLKYVGEYDMVVGCRTRADSRLRSLGNAVLARLASRLSGVGIPDLTSGFRCVKRSVLMEFMHLYPNGFSFPATSTLAFISAGYSVKFVRVNTRRRDGGKSKIHPLQDATRFIVVILRIVSTFYPLKVFVPASIFSILMAILWSIRTVMISGQVSPVGAIFLIVGVFLLLFGLLADQMASIRMEIGRIAGKRDTERVP